MSKKRTGETLADILRQTQAQEAQQTVDELHLQFPSGEARESAATGEHVSRPKRKHTIYLGEAQSRKLRLYAAHNDLQLSHVVEALIERHL